MTDAAKIAGLFAALGAEDPQGWAVSEVEENLPQLARYRLLRALWQDVQSWDRASIGALHDEVNAETASVDQVVDLGRIARLVARQATFDVLYRLADPDGDELPATVREQLPGWRLTETSPAGRPTHRALDALYEDFDAVGPETEAIQSRTVAAGWIWDANTRPFCESLAAEVGYDFDDSDWQAIAGALPDTDDDQPRATWFTYPLVGRSRIDLRIARSVGGSEVSVHVEGPATSRFRIRIELLLGIMARYRIAPD
ncbi:hypothetical protein [Streptomyces sp. NPDC088794]|uniref:hypothetical protein n=1 Tax=Streptomyces sp. NPDC088794 TaxID=3365902 RepID=UPI003818F2A0